MGLEVRVTGRIEVTRDRPKTDVPLGRDRESAIESMLMESRYASKRDISMRVFRTRKPSGSQDVAIRHSLAKLEKYGEITSERVGMETLWKLTDEGEEIVRRRHEEEKKGIQL